MIWTGKKGKLEERCLKRARKNLKFFQKWGKLMGGFYALISIITIGMGFFLCWFTIHLVKNLAGLAPNAPNNNQVINAADQGLALGMALGFTSGFFIYKGAMHLRESINFFRCVPNDHLLILYHDLALKLTNDAEELPEGDEKQIVSG